MTLCDCLRQSPEIRRESRKLGTPKLGTLKAATGVPKFRCPKFPKLYEGAETIWDIRAEYVDRKEELEPVLKFLDEIDGALWADLPAPIQLNGVQISAEPQSPASIPTSSIQTTTCKCFV